MRHRRKRNVMFRHRFLPLLVALLVVFGGLTACAESPADEPAPPESAAIGPTEAPAAAEAATEVASDDRPMDANGCRPSAAEVLESLTAETGAAGATINQTATQLLDVSDMIYGTWEVNAVSVTTQDGVEEVAVWVTKVVPPGQWSSSAAEGALAYAVNDVAVELSSFEMADADTFGRPVTVEDPDVMAAMACLQ
jgi:hypothetical protein